MRLAISFAAALTGLIFVMPAAPVSAAALGNGPGAFVGLSEANPLVVQVQRSRRFPPRRPPPSRSSRSDAGAAAAFGIIGGLLLGAIIANEAQRQQSIDYCIRRYRSYDPRTMTYLGYDGLRHRCP